MRHGPWTKPAPVHNSNGTVIRYTRQRGTVGGMTEVQWKRASDRPNYWSTSARPRWVTMRCGA